MAEQFICELDNRALITIGGEEARSFLQGILTCNVEAIEDGKCGFGGLLSPQGKILFDFFVLRIGDVFQLDVDNSLSDELVKRLIFYRLRAKVNIEQIDRRVFATWKGGRPELENATIVKDPRLQEMGWRIYADDAPNGTKADYSSYRIEHGMPEGGLDYEYGSAFPHEALYDQIGGLDFSKGCYVGQEVISRVHHRGTARKRIIKVAGESPLPEPGTSITANGKSVGELTSVSNNIGLAILRMDRVKDALDSGAGIFAGDTAISVSIQEWVNFDWPGN